jgi:hypothetical protein
MDCQPPHVSKIDNDDDELDEYEKVVPAQSVPPTPGIKRTYKETSSVS